MLPIAFDSIGRLKLASQNSQRVADFSSPMQWHRFLADLNDEYTGKSIEDTRWCDSIRGHARLFSWQMSAETISVSLLGGVFVYLCWGVPQREYWKKKAFALVLSRAEFILVNDVVTQQEIYHLTGRVPHMVPFFVDTAYFDFRPLSSRSDFVFFNGTNDRDPEVPLRLAEEGVRVVWLANNARLRSMYEGRSRNLEIKSEIDFRELRSLYQTCRALVIPGIRDAHCAGQTTGMEAISCGAPIIMNQGRTSSIFAGFPSVFTLSNASIGDWIEKLKMLRRDALLSDKTVNSRTMLQSRLSKDKLKSIFLSVLDADHKRSELRSS